MEKFSQTKYNKQLKEKLNRFPDACGYSFGNYDVTWNSDGFVTEIYEMSYDKYHKGINNGWLVWKNGKTIKK